MSKYVSEGGHSIPGECFEETAFMIILQNSIQNFITTLILIRQTPGKYV